MLQLEDNVFHKSLSFPEVLFSRHVFVLFEISELK